MARFSKAQYEMLAATLRAARPRDPEDQSPVVSINAEVSGLNRRSQWREDVIAITDMLALDNQAFDRNRFYEAVGW